VRRGRHQVTTCGDFFPHARCSAAAISQLFEFMEISNSWEMDWRARLMAIPACPVCCNDISHYLFRADGIK